MFQKIGYSLIDSANVEVQFWGNSLNIFVDAPNRIFLSNGNIVEGATPYASFIDGSMLVERWIESNPVTELDVKIDETIEFREDKIVVIYNYERPELSSLKTHIKSKVAAKRWEIETGGITIDNIQFATDRESQTKYTAVAIAISRADPNTWTINWKTNTSNFVTLNATQMDNAINTILYYVQESFNREYILVQEIDAAQTIEELLLIDIQNGWPNKVYTTDKN